MSDWQKGDLALCLGPSNNGRPRSALPGPKRGAIVTVEAVVIVYSELGLVIQGFPSSHPTRAFIASAFRKIRPSAIKHIEALKDVPLHVRENEHA